MTTMTKQGDTVGNSQSVEGLTEAHLREVAELDHQAQKTAREARRAFTEAVWEAQDRGMTVSEISRHVGHLSRQRIYTLLEKESKDRGQPLFIAAFREWARERGHLVSDKGEVDQSLKQDYLRWRNGATTSSTKGL